MLDDRDAPQTAAGQAILAADQVRSGSMVLLAVAMSSLALTLFLTSGRHADVDGTVWIVPVLWGCLWVMSMAFPIEATAIGLGLAGVVTLYNLIVMTANHVYPTSGMSMQMTWIALLAASHNGFRRRARRGRSYPRQSRVFCEAVVPATVPEPAVVVAVEGALGTTGSLRPSAGRTIWDVALDHLEPGHRRRALLAVGRHEGAISIAVRLFVPASLLDAAEGWAKDVVRAVSRALSDSTPRQGSTVGAADAGLSPKPPFGTRSGDAGRNGSAGTDAAADPGR